MGKEEKTNNNKKGNWKKPTPKNEAEGEISSTNI